MTTSPTYPHPAECDGVVEDDYELVPCRRTDVTRSAGGFFYCPDHMQGAAR